MAHTSFALRYYRLAKKMKTTKKPNAATSIVFGEERNIDATALIGNASLLPLPAPTAKLEAEKNINSILVETEADAAASLLLSENKVEITKKNSFWDKIFFAFIVAFNVLQAAMTYYMN